MRKLLVLFGIVFSTPIMATYSIEFPPIYFAHGSHQLDKKAKKTIQEVFSHLEKKFIFKLTLEGHSEMTEGSMHDTTLSYLRAKAVKHELERIANPQCISIFLISYGSSKPLFPANSINNYKNRRVHFLISNPDFITPKSQIPYPMVNSVHVDLKKNMLTILDSLLSIYAPNQIGIHIRVSNTNSILYPFYQEGFDSAFLIKCYNTNHSWFTNRMVNADLNHLLTNAKKLNKQRKRSIRKQIKKYPVLLNIQTYPVSNYNGMEYSFIKIPCAK